MVTFITITGILGLAGLMGLGLLIGLTHKPEPTTFPDGDPHALDYCHGCGCRHRRMWMDWNAYGVYRCHVCCHGKEF